MIARVPDSKEGSVWGYSVRHPAKALARGKINRIRTVTLPALPSSQQAHFPVRVDLSRSFDIVAIFPDSRIEAGLLSRRYGSALCQLVLFARDGALKEREARLMRAVVSKLAV